MRDEETTGLDRAKRRAKNELEGLVPSAAQAWLDLQSALAWEPEAVADRLRAGATPEEILDARHSQLQLVPRDAQSADARGPSKRTGIDRRNERVGRLERLGLRVVPLTSRAYPPPLAELVDAPLVLLVRGRVPVLRTPSIAIVGARAATQAARETARRLGRELAAAGLTIVSGLARGIDAEAHRGALEAKGRTIGVLACGPDQIYPPEHRALADEMTERGAVISEMPLGVPPRRALFPLRNRIISGLCLGVIVVEARRRSGSLITVRHALGQGRDVFVVPGSVDGPFAEGTNLLLRDGARSVCGAQDVLEDLGWVGQLPSMAGPDSVSPSANPIERELLMKNSKAMRIMNVLEAGPASRDALQLGAGLNVAEFSSALFELELDGCVVLERDGRIRRTW